jgi:hypothetical protein
MPEGENIHKQAPFLKDKLATRLPNPVFSVIWLAAG